MADSAVVHIGENSPQQVAYKLMKDIMLAEQMSLTGASSSATRVDRKYLLTLYYECARATLGLAPQ
jgi:hypothetical protein